MVTYPVNWYENRLGDVCKYVNGTALEEYFSNYGNRRVISLGNYSEEGKYIDDGNRINLNQKTQSFLLFKDDLSMVLNDKGNGRLVGKVLFIDENDKYIFNQRSLRIVPEKNKVAPLFLYHLINSGIFRDRLKPHIQGNTQVYINPPAVMSIPIYLPSLQEQQAIASALSDFDEHIDNLTELIEKKKAIRDGALEDLVSGRTRLDGFDGEWEEGTIGDILTIHHGKNQHSVESFDGKYPILGTGGIIGKATEFLCDWECVLIGRKGTIDNPMYMNTPFWTIDTLYYSKPKINQCVKFQYYLFCTINWLDYAESSGRPSLAKNVIEGVPISIPNIPEQQAIAQVLSAMDEEIESLKIEKDKMIQIKEGAMDDLLTGRVRLKV